MNLPFVAAEVRRRTLLGSNDIRLVTSAATVQGLNARILRGNLSTILSPLVPRGERKKPKTFETVSLRARRPRLYEAPERTE